MTRFAHSLLLAGLAALLAAAPLAAQEREPAPAPAPAATPPPWRQIDAFAPFYDPAQPPPNSWAMPFGHLDTLEAPYVNAAHLAASVQRFDRYCKDVAARGFNVVFVGNLIHIASFDGVEGGPVYGPASPFRARALAYQQAFRRAIARAKAHGVRVVIETDFPAWTPELLDWLGPRGVELDNERLWLAYQAAVDELLGSVGFAGVMVRIGEGGGSYDEATGYKSGVRVKTVADTRLALDRLLTLVERFNAAHQADKKLLFRTWTIGIGEIGALHTSPELYERVFAGFGPRKALYTVIKHVAMDFFQHVPLNRTIGVGEVDQLVEFQARREYEGFGLFPNTRAEPFRDAIQRFAKSPRFQGVSVWPLNGGFLLPSPTYYRSQGPDRWIDVNVFAYGQLLLDARREPAEVVAEWVRAQGVSEADAPLATEILLAGDDVMGKGMYVRPYAEKAPALFGLEVFPTMLWFYWTRPVGALGVQALIARYALPERERAVAEGREALAELDGLIAKTETLAESNFRRDLLTALRFQRSSFAFLAAYREVFLHHHAWATGDGAAEAYRRWQEGLAPLSAALDAHETEWRDDHFFQPWDLRELRREVRDGRWIPRLRPWAAALALLDLLLVALLVAGLRPEPPPALAWTHDWAGALVAACLVSFACAASLAILASGSALALVANLGGFGALVGWLVGAAALDTARGEGPRPPVSALSGALLLLAPSLTVCALLLLGYAARGPLPAYALLVGALTGSGAARAVLVLGWLAAFALACGGVWLAVRRSTNGPTPRQARCAVAILLLFLLIKATLLAQAGVRGLLVANEVLRLGPTVLNQAGTHVEDLVE